MPLVNTSASDPNTVAPNTGTTPPPHVMSFDEFRTSQPSGVGGADTRYQSYLGSQGLQATGSVLTNQYNIGALPTADALTPPVSISQANQQAGGTASQGFSGGYGTAPGAAITPPQNAPAAPPVLPSGYKAPATPTDLSGVSNTDDLAKRTQDLIAQGLYTPDMQAKASQLGQQLQGQGATDANSAGAVAYRQNQGLNVPQPVGGAATLTPQTGASPTMPPVSPTGAPTAAIAPQTTPTSQVLGSAPTTPPTQSATMSPPAVGGTTPPATVAPAPVPSPVSAPAPSGTTGGAPVSAPIQPTYTAADGTIQNGTPSSLTGLLKQYGLDNFDPSNYTASESSMKTLSGMLEQFKSSLADTQYQDFVNIVKNYETTFQQSYQNSINNAAASRDVNTKQFQDSANYQLANNNVQLAQLTAEKENQIAIVNNKNAHLEGYLKGSLMAMGVDPASTAGISYMATQTNMALLNASQIAASYNTPIVQLQNSSNNIMANLTTNVAKEQINYNDQYNQRTDTLNNNLLNLDEKVFSSEQVRNEAKTQAITDWANTNIQADSSRDQRVQQWNQIAFQSHQTAITNYRDLWSKYISASPYMIQYDPANPDKITFSLDDNGQKIPTAVGIQRELMAGRLSYSMYGTDPFSGQLPGLPSTTTKGTLRTGVAFQNSPNGQVIIPNGANAGDCGAFINDINGTPGLVNDTWESKKALVQSTTPAPGMTFAMPSLADPAAGHVGRVESYNAQTGMVSVVDSNWDGKGTVLHHDIPVSSIVQNGGGFFYPPVKSSGQVDTQPQTVKQQQLGIQQTRLDQSTTRIEAAAGKTITADPIVKRYEAALPSFNEIQADAKAPLNSISSMKLLDLYTRINTGQGVNQYNISGILQGSSLSDTAQRGIMQMFSTGGELSATQKKELLEAATSSMVSLQNDYQNTLKSYQDVNKARGINTSTTAPDLSLTVGQNVPASQTGTLGGVKYTTTTPTPSDTVKMIGKAGTKWEGKTYVVPHDKVDSYTANGFDITQ